MPQTWIWVGASGIPYRYGVYQVGDDLPADPGNYIFVALVSIEWLPIYAGQAKKLSERFDDHHKERCIDHHGATHIHVRVNNGGKQARLDEEADIVQNYPFLCNG